MTIVKAKIRSGAYYDSVVLMQLQRSLAALPGILDAGVVMGTEANKDILAQTGLLAPEAGAASLDSAFNFRRTRIRSLSCRRGRRY